MTTPPPEQMFQHLMSTLLNNPQEGAAGGVGTGGTAPAVQVGFPVEAAAALAADRPGLDSSPRPGVDSR
jgi:hypothetical protein